jgi:hypothetical protein
VCVCVSFSSASCRRWYTRVVTPLYDLVHRTSWSSSSFIFGRFRVKVQARRSTILRFRGFFQPLQENGGIFP